MILYPNFGHPTKSHCSRSDLSSEAQATLQLAVPLVFTQICATSIGADVNVVMMSLLGTQTLATASLGAFTFFKI